jgi:multidrug efflux pump subunit AcrA (membrane-fusion protein)
MNFFRFGRRLAVRLFILTFIVIIAAFGVACNRSESRTREANSESSGNTEDVIPVTQAKAQSREIPSFIQATGTLIADESSNVAPKVAGKVVNVSVNVGDFVRQGSIIAKIDDKDALLNLAEAKARLNQAIVGVRQAEARLGLGPNGKFDSSAIPEVRAAAANYEQAQAELKQAEANEKRYRELVETGDVAMITYEQYRTARDTARARANNARQQLEAAINNAKQNNEAIKSAQAAVEAARTQVATAEQAVADTVIRAPFSGFVSSRPTAVGEFVTSASIIATILRTNPMKVQIQVAEADVPYISIGRGVSIDVDAYKDRKFAGTVIAINPSIDAASRSATVEAQIENNDNALRSGMFATVRITREGGSTGIFVPKEAIYNDLSTQSYRVFVIQNSVARLQVVQLGTEENGFVQILSGVNADEMIATSNVEKLYEGAKVQIQ